MVIRVKSFGVDSVQDIEQFRYARTETFNKFSLTIGSILGTLQNI